MVTIKFLEVLLTDIRVNEIRVLARLHSGSNYTFKVKKSNE